MFSAPPSTNAEIFVRIPEKFHVKNRNSSWVNVQRHGAYTPIFLEGPSFDRDGNLWVVDIPWGRLFKITPSGDVSCEFEYDGWPNGLKFHSDGRAFIADFKNGIMIFDPLRGAIEPFVDRILLEPLKGVNDLVFASDGSFFFTDQGQSGLDDRSGRLFHASEGRIDCILDGIPSPNGLALDESETTLFLAVTRDNAIWRVPLRKEGGAVKVGVFIRLSGGVGPDGLAMDKDGGLAVCHVGMGAVWLFDKLGEPILRIRAPTGLITTNCAYGGADNGRLFITENQTVLVADVPVPGLAMYSHC